MSTSYKIIVVGDGGVGKTTFIKRHRTGQFESKYIATMGVDVHPLTFNTNHGPIIFKIWDCAGQEKFGGLREGYYQKAQGAIVMFDVSSTITCDHVSPWIQNVRSVAPDLPVIICGNKCDIPERKVTGRIEAQDLPNVKYYEVSARSNYNFEKPFLDLARKLTGHEDLQFEEMPPISPPEVKIKMNPPQKVCWVDIPGGKMKVTYEFYLEGTEENM